MFLLLLLLPFHMLPITQGDLFRDAIKDDFDTFGMMKDMIKKEIKAELKVELEENIVAMRDLFSGHVKKIVMKDVKGIMEVQHDKYKDKLKQNTEHLMMKIEELNHSNNALRQIVENQESWMKNVLHSMNANESSSAIASPRRKEDPHVMTCAYKGYWTSANSTVTYDRLLSDHTSNGGEGKLDITTGVFTCLTGGHYTVTVSGSQAVFPGKEILSFLYHNGEKVDATRWYSTNNRKNEGYIGVQGSISVIIHLQEGDSLEFKTEASHFSGRLFFLTFCVSLTGAD